MSVPMPPPVMAGPLIPTSHPTFLGMQQEEIDRIVGEVMRFILFNHNNKTPTKLEMINRHVMKKRCPGGIKLILADARRRFKELYGYELVEIPLHLVQSASKAQKEHAKRKLAKANTSYRKEKDKEQESKRKKKATAKTTSKLYILKNSSDEQDDMRTMNELSDFNKFDVAIRGLLFSIFGLIYIKGGAIEEAVLWKYLERWGLSQKMKNHEMFGDVDKLIRTVFCKQMYLRRQKIVNITATQSQATGEAATQYEYVFGARALMETNRSEIYGWVAMEVLGQSAPDDAILNQIRLQEQRREDARREMEQEMQE